MVNETKVVGKFRDVESAKQLLMVYPDKSSHGNDHANRFVAEVAPNGTLNRDPNWVGGQNQGLGMETGFNKCWYSWNDINALMDLCEVYLQGGNKMVLKVHYGSLIIDIFKK